jgi:hypothetical protein
VVSEQTVGVGGDGRYTTSAFAPSQAGTYWWTVDYSGDANNNPAVSPCGAEKVTMSAQTLIATSPGAGAPLGAPVTDTATLSAGSSPTGAITFVLSGPSAAPDCSAVVSEQTVPVSGNGSYTSPPFTPSQLGTYWWTARYSGDDKNLPAASRCGDESVTISPFPTSPSPGGPVGTTVTDTATLSGGNSPTGTIDFKLWGPSATVDCTVLVADQTVTVSGNGRYTSPPVMPPQPGTYWWTVTYSGDSHNPPAISRCGDESVTISPGS